MEWSLSGKGFYEKALILIVGFLFRQRFQFFMMAIIIFIHSVLSETTFRQSFTGAIRYALNIFTIILGKEKFIIFNVDYGSFYKLIISNGEIT